jgi:hypothetical protein
MNVADTTKGSRLREGVRAVLSDAEGLFRARLRPLPAVPPPVVEDVLSADGRPGFQVAGEAARCEDPVRTVKAVYSNLLLLLRTTPLSGGIIEPVASMRFTSRWAGILRGCHPHPPPSGNWSPATFGGLSWNSR